MQRVKWVYFIGIGGSGMSGIAEVLQAQGYKVSGSDLFDSPVLEHLRSVGIEAEVGHESPLLDAVDVVVISTAIPADNPQLCQAKQLGIPVVRRAEMLGELMRFRHGIAVAGTHGKTTTTGMLVSLFQAAQYSPGFVLGAALEGKKVGHAQLGEPPYMLVEADESDASFLCLHPISVLVLNIDVDHMGTYAGSLETLKAFFLDFIHRTPFYGTVLICNDCPIASSLIAQINRRVVTYGFSQDADYVASSIEYDGTSSRFKVCRPNGLSDLTITLKFPGKHSVSNMLGAIAMASEEGLKNDAIVEGASQFVGVSRRFDVYEDTNFYGNVVTIIDDYGHHPTELLAMMEAVQQHWSERRVVMVYQPHRFTRTRDLFDEFVAALAKVDVLIMYKTYTAGEKYIEGADSFALCEGVKNIGKGHVTYADNFSDLDELLKELVRGQDVVILQGAGDIGEFLPCMLTNECLPTVES